MKRRIETLSPHIKIDAVCTICGYFVNIISFLLIAMSIAMSIAI